MTHKTKGIVLRVIKYGETSVVVTLFTMAFGVQAYLVNGVRSAKKAGSKAIMFQPAALLDMEVYHNELKAMQRLKECSWSYLYEGILSDVIKNSIALFMVELLQKTLKQPEEQSDLFDFCEHAFIELDRASPEIAANFPLFFIINLPEFFGFKIHNNYSERRQFLDLQEGTFTETPPAHNYSLEGDLAVISSELLNFRQPAELAQLKLNHETRRTLLLHYQDYYRLHLNDFGQMKTIPILHQVLS